MYTTKGEKQKKTNEWGKRKKRGLLSFGFFALSYTHTHTNKTDICAYTCCYCFVQYFLKKCTEERERKMKTISCISIIKAKHTHTQKVRCTQIRQMRENKYRCRIRRKMKQINVCFCLFISRSWSIRCNCIRWSKCWWCWCRAQWAKWTNCTKCWWHKISHS